MLSTTYLKLAPPRALLLAAPLLLWLASSLLAQSPKLTVDQPALLTVKHGAAAELKLNATLNEGFHANSHTPAEENLIPLTLKWDAGPLHAVDVDYPAPRMEKYEFSDKPLSVVAGRFTLTTKFTADPKAHAGPATMTGKLRYQACNNNACFPPKTVEINAPVVIQ